jgi:large subunit ribosomal protein L10
VLLRLDIEAKKQFVQKLQRAPGQEQGGHPDRLQGSGCGHHYRVARQKLREAQVEYQVIKNTMLRGHPKAYRCRADQRLFQRPSAIAVSYDDPVAPAKILTDFAKTNDKLEIKVGVINGKVMDPARSKPWRRCRPARCCWPGAVGHDRGAHIVGAGLSDVPRRMLNVLQAIKEQKEQQAA